MTDTLEALWREIRQLRAEIERLKVKEGVFTPAWDDLRVAATASNLGGSKDPGYAKFVDDAGGTSQGCFLYWFDAGSEEEVYFEVQIPHGYDEGSDIMPHVHWTPKSAGGAGKVVSWGLEYAWKNIGGTFGDTTIVYANAHTPADDSLVASKHYLTAFAAIDGNPLGTNFTLSSMLVCRLFRNATGAGSSTDDYTADAGLLEFDIHVQFNSLGSRTETVK